VATPDKNEFDLVNPSLELRAPPCSLEAV